MEISQLETLGKVAGIGGIAIGAVVLMGRAVITKMTKLNRKQSFWLAMVLSIGMWLIGVLGVLAWWNVSRVQAVERESKEVPRQEDLPQPMITQSDPMVATNTITPPPRRMVRRETIRLDLRRPLNGQIKLYEGDRLKLVSGAIEAIERIDVGGGWKTAKKGQVYVVPDNRTVVPQIDPKEVKIFGRTLNMIQSSKSAVMVVEVTSTSEIGKSRKD